MGTGWGHGGWGLGELGLDLGRGLCCSKQLILLISRPLGFGVGTRGWGQGGDREVGVRGIRVGFGSTIVLKHSNDFTD